MLFSNHSIWLDGNFESTEKICVLTCGRLNAVPSSLKLKLQKKENQIKNEQYSKYF